MRGGGAYSCRFMIGWGTWKLRVILDRQGSSNDVDIRECIRGWDSQLRPFCGGGLVT